MNTATDATDLRQIVQKETERTDHAVQALEWLRCTMIVDSWDETSMGHWKEGLVRSFRNTARALLM